MRLSVFGGIRVYWIAVLIVAAVVAVGRIGQPRSAGQPMPVPAASAGASVTAPRPMTDNVVAYHTGDRKMVAAKARARETLPRFLDLVASGTPGTYSVKFPLTQNGETEHIWLQVDRVGDGVFDGRLANTPVNGNRYRLGDRMSVARDDVEDWTIRKDDVIYGGYSIRVALADMPPDRAEAFGRRFRD